MKLSTKSDEIKVVLDTNIVVSSLIAEKGASARIFEKILLGEVINYTSEEIIEELKEVFSRKEITKRTGSKIRDFILKNYLRSSIKISKKTEFKLVEHGSDNKFIEIAVDANTSYIVTGDHHLLELKKLWK